MAKPGGNPRRRHNEELRRWVTAMVQKATPKIAKSLIEAAEWLDEPKLRPQDQTARHAPEGPQDESLAGLLLRLLRTHENGGTENVAATTSAPASQNPSVG